MAATPTAKTNVLEWIGGINTNLALVGLAGGRANYTPKRTYDIPMADTDITGWLKGFQAAIELKPEIVFVLSADWGSMTSQDFGTSYFLKQDMLKRYKNERIEYFLSDDDFKEEWEGYLAEFDQLRSVSFKLLELENQARVDADIQPKVVRDWDEILYSNEIEIPLPPMPEDQYDVGMMPAETRYTLDEVIQSFFTIVMDNYRQLGFPRINFVMLQGDGGSKNSTQAASLMNSDAKFKNLAKMVNGRFRVLKGQSKINNLLDQTIDDALDAIELETTEEF